MKLNKDQLIAVIRMLVSANITDGGSYVELLCGAYSFRIQLEHEDKRSKRQLTDEFIKQIEALYGHEDDKGD